MSTRGFRGPNRRPRIRIEKRLFLYRQTGARVALPVQFPTSRRIKTFVKLRTNETIVTFIYIYNVYHEFNTTKDEYTRDKTICLSICRGAWPYTDQRLGRRTKQEKDMWKVLRCGGAGGGC